MKKTMFMFIFLVFILSSCTTKETILITFETNGGNVIDQAEFELSPTNMVLPTPEKVDYQFDGWYLDTTLTTPFSYDNLVDLTSVTLYAKWVYAVQGISFNSNGGSAIAPIQVNPGDPISEPIPVLLDHIFRGWYTDSTLTQKYTFENMPSENILLFAKWLSIDDIDTYIQQVFASNNFSLTYSMYRSLDPIDSATEIYSAMDYKIDTDKIYLYSSYPAFDESYEGYIVKENQDYMSFSRTCTDDTINCWSRYVISDDEYQDTISTFQFNTIIDILLGDGLNMSWFNQDILTFTLDEDYYQDMSDLLFDDDIQLISSYEITLTEEGFNLSFYEESPGMYVGFVIIVTDVMQTHIDVPIFDVCEEDLFDYNYDDDGAIITGYYGDPIDLTISNQMPYTDIIGIEAHAFEGLATLERVELPSTIEAIGDSAFANCTNLDTVFINSTSVPTLGTNVFLNTSSTLIIYVPIESLSLYQNAPNWSAYANNIVAGTYYAVTFDGNGGTLISGQEVQQISSGGHAIAPVYENGSLYLYWNVTFNHITQNLLVTAQWSTTPITAEGFTFTLKDDLTYEVTSYTGSESNVYIQDTYLGAPVTSIGTYAFDSNSALRYLFMPDSIIRIENGAFHDCSYLETIVFSNQLTYIGPRAFVDCRFLRDVTFPETLEIIDDGAFQGCSRMTNFELPEGLVEIGDGAFSSIGNLRSISIPSSVEHIGDMVFYRCTNLESIIVSPNNLYYQSFDGVLYNKLGTKLLYYPSNRDNEAIFLDTLVTIGTYAFYESYFLTSLMLPLQITEIEDRAFQGCDQLEEIYIPSSVNIIGEYAFLGSYENLVIYTGASAAKAQWNTLWNSNNFSVVWDTLAYTVTFDGNGGALISGHEKQIIIANRDAIAPIYDNEGISFSGWNIPFINVSSNLTVVAQWNPDVSTDGVIFTLKDDNTYEVSGYTGTSSIVRIHNLYLDKPVTSIGRQAFFDNTSITQIYLPEGLIKLERYAFTNLVNLASINLPNSLEYISNYAFSGCSSLTEIDIPSGVYYIGSYVFTDTHSLTSINVNPSNPNFKSTDGILLDKSGMILYSVPSGLTGVVMIPDGVTRILDGAINGANQITDIVMPESLIMIGAWNFFNCAALENVTLFSLVPPQLGDESFRDCSLNIKIWVIDDVVDDYQGASSWSDFSDIIFSIVPYTVEFNTDGGTLVSGDEIQYVYIGGSAIEPIYERTNYYFNGWDASFNDITSDLIVTAQWISIDDASLGLQYVLKTDNTYEVTGYSGSELIVIIPNLYLSLAVTSIANQAFMGSQIEQVIILENMKSIGDQAFYQCQNLEEVSLGAGVESIGNSTFDQSPIKNLYMGSVVPPTLLGDLYDQGSSINQIQVPIDSFGAYLNDASWLDYALVLRPAGAFLVTFDGNLGTYIAGETTQWIAYGQAAIPPLFEKDGLMLTWSIDSNVITGDLEVIATWSIPTITLVFIDFDDTILYTDGTNNLSTYRISTLLTSNRLGYTFTQWLPTSFNPTLNAYYFAPNYTINEYTVSFETNGGSAIDSATYDYQEEIEIPENPTKQGYNFIEWCSDSDLLIPYVWGNMPAEDMVLYAKWERVITLIYINYDETELSREYYISGDDIELSDGSDLYRAGYTFVKWDLVVDEINYIIYAYATYSICSFTLSFDTNDGSELDSIIYQYQATLIEPEQTLKTGYTFIEWCSDPQLLTPYSFDIMPAYDFTLYAKWEINTYTLSFETNGGNNLSSEVLEYQSSFDSFYPTKDGFIFDGWYEDILLSITINQMPAEDIVIYAKWDNDGNAPVLFTGMNPIYYNSFGNTIAKYTNPVTLEENPSWDESLWYSYLDTSVDGQSDESKWANALTKDYSYWVWVPRFVYRITSGFHQNGLGEIEIKFIVGTDDTTANVPLVNTGNASDSNGTWTSHPAFTFGTTELMGFWIAKFEPSKESYNSVDYVRSAGGSSTWRSISLNNIFSTTRAMETQESRYGWLTSEVDSHMAKNSEWGAVTYLAHSKYGRNKNEVAFNSTYYAGGGINNAWLANQSQSTTGNHYGVFDMNGGASEYVAAYTYESVVPTQLGTSCVAAGDKYCDVYGLDFASGMLFKGDALYETSSGYSGNNAWQGDFSYWVSDSHNWFIRGGNVTTGSGSGLFCYSGTDYAMSQTMSFRPILVSK